MPAPLKDKDKLIDIRFQVKLDKETKRMLEDIAATMEVSESKAIRIAIEETYKELRKFRGLTP